MPAFGQATVEMAVVIPILLVLLIGAADFGVTFNAAAGLPPAAREGARHGAWWSSASLTNPYANDTAIVGAVSDNLAKSYGSGLSVIAAPSGVHSCPTGPLPNSNFPSTNATVWVYVCYNNTVNNTAIAPGQPITVTITEVSSVVQLLQPLVPQFHLSASSTINAEGL
jgi:Flp pilus assembly protein TadG